MIWLPDLNFILDSLLETTLGKIIISDFLMANGYFNNWEFSYKGFLGIVIIQLRSLILNIWFGKSMNID